MKKELMYVAPEAEILVAQVEKGFAASGDSGWEDTKPGVGWDD